ncbi:MAG TPA: hypothetical protein ACHBX0_04690 [Arsenophonus sp.]
MLVNLVTKTDLQQQCKIYLPQKLATTLSHHWQDKVSNLKLTTHNENSIILTIGNEILYFSLKKSVTAMMLCIIADKQIAISNR